MTNEINNHSVSNAQLACNLDTTKHKPDRTYHNQCRLILTIVLLSLGPFYLGFMLTYYSNFSPQTNENVFGETAAKTVFKAVLNAAIPAGAIFGALAAPCLMKLLTRKHLLVATNIAALVFQGILLVDNVYLFLVSRLFQGAFAGIFMGIVPVYIREITPVEVQGSYGVLTQLLILIGIVYSFAFGLGFDFGGLGDHAYYRAMSSVNIPFLVLQLVFLVIGYIPESPNSLIAKQEKQRAKEVIGMFTVPQLIDEVYQQKQQQVNIELQKEKDEVGNQEPIIYPCRAYFVAFEIAFMHQTTGLVALLTQTRTLTEEILPSFFKFVPLSIHAVQLVAVCFTVCILSRFGRRPLFLFGNFTLAVTNFFIAVLFYYEHWAPAGWIIFGFMIIEQAIFGLAIGSVTWLYIAEAVPAKTAPFATMMAWLSATIVIIITPIITEQTNGNPYISFMMFGTITLAAWLCNYFLMAQTKDQTARQIAVGFAEPVACSQKGQ